MTSGLGPYFIGLNRAMVSLGPLTQGTYCTYKCTFCYVNGPYHRYARRPTEEILAWLEERSDSFDVIYVSGDTDSFAPPRTAEALQLLTGLLRLGHDVLFTTRYVFSVDERDTLQQLQADYTAQGLLLIPCISVTQLTHPGLEPYPIPPPGERLAQIEWFHRNGFKVILTIRPFLPYVEAAEYAEIVRRGGPYCSVILGGNWYTDLGGIIKEKTRLSVNPPIALDVINVKKGSLDTGISDLEWIESSHPEAQRLAEEEAQRINKPFYMRSASALDFIRKETNA